jgi:hypothetical protein
VSEVPAVDPGPLDSDERAELVRLRQENAALRTRRRWPAIRWKAIAAALLIVIGVVLAPISVASVWAHNQLADTDRFVATVGPLAEDPAVRNAVTDRATDVVFSYVDVPALTNQVADALAAQGVPPRVVDRLRGLATPLAASLHGFVHDRVQGFVTSAEFAQLWDNAMRGVHQQLTAVLSGNSQTVTVRQGKVVLDLGPLIDRVKNRLVEAGFSPAAAVPEVHPTVAVADASTLIRAQNGYSLLDKVASWLPWLAAVLLAAGIFLARDHRKALRNTGLGVAGSMLVLAVVLLVARSAVIGGVPERSVAAVTSSFDIVVHFLRVSLRTLFAVGIAVAIGAALVGPSTTAVAIRRGSARALSGLRDRLPGGSAGGRVGTWVHAHRALLRIGAVVVAVLVFVLLSQPGAIAVVIIAAVLVVCLAVIQFLDRPGVPPSSPG